jgi:hypothetical protein
MSPLGCGLREEPMPLRIFGPATGPVLGAGLAAFSAAAFAQNAPPAAGNSMIQVAQATTQPGPAEAKTAKKKIKKPTNGSAGGAESRQPAATYGPPDPGKY